MLIGWLSEASVRNAVGDSWKTGRKWDTGLLWCFACVRSAGIFCS